MKSVYRSRRRFVIGSLMTLALVLPGGMALPAPATAEGSPWVNAYFASWMHDAGSGGQVPTAAIDWAAFTHMTYFALGYNANGTIKTGNMNQTRINAITAAAHANGKPILVAIGGWGNTEFATAIQSANRAAAVSNIVNFMVTNKFDGIDLDMEPIGSGDVANFEAFVNALHTALQTKSTPLLARPLLTAAVLWQVPMFGRLQAKFDQINLMTYDMAGAYEGWVTWHNAPITDGGFRFPSTGNAPPSCEGRLNSAINAGVPISKLGIGIDFYGYVWSGGTGTPTGGATAPRQSWTAPPTVTDNVAYYNIMNSYYQPARYRWDAGPQAAYLSIDEAGSAGDKFISYDDETTCRKKVEYVRSRGSGGLIIWELGGGYRADQPAGQRDLLLQAVKAALNAGGGDAVAPTCSITSPAAGSTVLGTVGVLAGASDNVGVTRVDLLVDGVLKGSDTSSPWQVDLNTTALTNGSHTLVAKAYDAAGNSGSSASVSVSVNNPPVGDTTAPTCSLTSPAAGATVSGTANVSANASDNVGVARVEFKVDGTLRSTDTTSPYGFSLDTTALSNGSHTVSAQSFDSAGNSSSASSVSVNVSNGGVGGSSADLWISRDGLASGWSNASWNTTVNFANGSPVYAGTSSISATSTARWGGLSLRHSTTITNPSSYLTLEFLVHGGVSPETLYVLLENAASVDGFTQVNAGVTVANGWKKVSIPLSQLNPNGSVFDRIHIQSDSVDVYYVDEYRLVGTAGSDTAVPIVTITGPTSNATYTTSLSSITLTGSASDNVGVSSVSSSHGSVSGTTSWSNVVTLVAGTNVITITARDAAGNSATDSITVTYTPPDSTPPSLSVSPSASVTLSGTAADAGSGVASVSYSNAANGATGTASGTTSWNAVVPVVGGSNAITIKVTDGAGLVTSKVVTVNVTLP